MSLRHAAFAVQDPKHCADMSSQFNISFQMGDSVNDRWKIAYSFFFLDVGENGEEEGGVGFGSVIAKSI